MSTIANPLTFANPTGMQSSAAPATRTDPLATESTFLTLLVSQLKNQDPLAPADSTQFITQLTQYSQLEQLIGIHKDTSSLEQTTPPQTDGTSQSNTTTGAQ